MTYQRYTPARANGASFTSVQKPLSSVKFLPTSRAPRWESDFLLDCHDFQLRMASDRRRQIQSSVLVERRYAWRGYKVGKQQGAVCTDTELTLQVCIGRRVFGTLTVRNDSGNGLAADALYKSEIDAYRIAGRRVTEVTRLAVDPELGSKEVLGVLFHAAYEACGSVYGANDIFIEVNPRHVAFYRRMMNFHAVGEEKVCPRVDAPAVLLQVDVSYMRKQAALYGGRAGEVAARSLYPYFCSPTTADDMVSRLLTAALKRDHSDASYPIAHEAVLQGSRAQSPIW